MKCPKCGSLVRPSKKYPGYYLCDNCRKRYPGSSIINNVPAQSVHSEPASPRKRHKKNYSFAKLLIVFFSLILLAAGLYFSGIFQLEQVSEPKSENVETFSATDTATLNNMNLNILSLQTSTGNDLIKPNDGNVFLLIEVNVQNTSDQLKNVNSASDFALLQNGEPISYNASPYSILSEEQSRLHFDLEPNETATGFLCYEVPNDWTTLTLQYVNPKWSLQKIQIELSNTH